MGWYRTGTVTTVNGSTSVVGVQTLWASQVKSGDLFTLDGDKFYEIDTITDDTHLTLKTPFLGAGGSAQSYAIIRNFTSTLPAQLAQQLAQLMTDYHVTLDELTGWLSGTGTVTVHDGAGNAYQVKTPAQLSAEWTGMLVKSVAGSGDIALTTTEAGNSFMTFTGTLTGNRNVIVPAATRRWIVVNNTTGNFALTVKTQNGAGRAIRQGGCEAIWCDGTDVKRTDSDALKADLAGATFTGPVNVPTLAAGATGQGAANADFVNAAIAAKESLLALSQSIHSGAIVKAFFYDTSRDSDGGAWRKRCQDKSWYNESLNGTWLGQAASAAAAWALTGAVTGSYFQNTTDGKFYALGASSPNVTEVFRGNRAEFPEQAAIIAESGRVIIYDLTQSGCPMWMVFSDVSGSMIRLSGAGSSVTALNGQLFVGSTSNGLQTVSFIADAASRINGASYSWISWSIAQRNQSLSTTTDTTRKLPSSTVNDVTMTVLPDAPIDIATGLPIPTIAVATAGGVSIIKSDGTVVNQTSTNATNQTVDRIAITGDRMLWQKNTDYIGLYIGPIPSSTGTYSTASRYTTAYDASSMLPLRNSSHQAIARGSAGGSLGLSVLKENPAAPAKGMVAYITNAYNTGWMVGDIRGAWLADIVPEVLTASGELVTNGAFTTDTSGWTPTNATLSVVSGAMRITATAASPVARGTSFTTVVGKTYKITAQVVTSAGAGKNCFLNVGTSSGGVQYLNATMSGTGVFSYDFTATSTTAYVDITGGSNWVSGDFADVDNVSCKLAEPDRSVKNTGLIVNGSITKAAVATGAQLVAYSGFSASNYLEQPYNANLDFGTGDFHVIGWANVAANASTQYLMERTDAGLAGARIELLVTSAGALQAYINGTLVGSSVAGVASSTFRQVALVRRSGVCELYVDSVLVTSGGGSAATLTNATALTRLGVRVNGASPASSSSLTLWRMSATAPSADQIAHIYNTEKMLFQPNAKCAIDGTSTAVTALAYDENEDALHVGTSWGRSKFRDLVRVESAATSVGSITSLSAGQGCHITGGASSVRFYQPAFYLREELRRKEEARKALGKLPAFFDFDATTGQTAFALPKGWTVKAVYSAGTLKRLGSTKDYVTSFDGFVETVNFGVAPGNAVWVSVMAIRSN